MNREEALSLVRNYTENENLVRHMLAVEASLIAYAKRFGEDEAMWSLCGILHDFDYEKMGDEHPSAWGQAILREDHVDEEICEAIAAHGKRESSHLRKTKLAKALFAVDTLTGFIVACALVRPDRLKGLDIDSIKKRMKKKDFARAICREDIKRGAEELGVSCDEHLQTVLDAMKGIHEEIGL